MIATRILLIVTLGFLLLPLPGCTRDSEDATPSDDSRAEQTADFEEGTTESDEPDTAKRASSENDTSRANTESSPRNHDAASLRGGSEFFPENVQSGDELPYETRVLLGAEEMPPPFLADLLTRSDVRQFFGYDGELTEKNLAGKPLSPTYQAVRLATASSFGFAIELEKMRDRNAVVQTVRDLRDSWFEGSDRQALGNAAIGHSSGVRSLAIGSVATGFLVIVSCEESLCREDQLVALGLVVKHRLETGSQ